MLREVTALPTCAHCYAPIGTAVHPLALLCTHWHCYAPIGTAMHPLALLCTHWHCYAPIVTAMNPLALLCTHWHRKATLALPLKNHSYLLRIFLVFDANWSNNKLFIIIIGNAYLFYLIVHFNCRQKVPKRLVSDAHSNETKPLTVRKTR